MFTIIDNYLITEIPRYFKTSHIVLAVLSVENVIWLCKVYVMAKYIQLSLLVLYPLPIFSIHLSIC